MSTTRVGQKAERLAARFLEKEGYKIVAFNWRTRVCEIDVVARRNDVIYFVEVKYRSSEKQGNGLEYITSSKNKKMHFAAEMWNQANEWNGDYRLLAVAASDHGVEDVVEID